MVTSNARALEGAIQQISDIVQISLTREDLVALEKGPLEGRLSRSRGVLPIVVKQNGAASGVRMRYVGDAYHVSIGTDVYARFTNAPVHPQHLFAEGSIVGSKSGLSLGHLVVSYDGGSTQN